MGAVLQRNVKNVPIADDSGDIWTIVPIRDRVLGESRTEAVRSPVVVLTGNALQMGGDSGSRTLTIELTPTDPIRKTASSSIRTFSAGATAIAPRSSRRR